MTEVYIVKRVYGCGWKCSKGSFPLNDEVDGMNDRMIVAITATKTRALTYAYLKTVKLYEELTEYDEERDDVNLNLDTTSDEEIEKWLVTMRDKLTHDDLYYWYDVVRWTVLN